MGNFLSRVLNFPLLKARGIKNMAELQCPGCEGVTNIALTRTNPNMPVVTLRGIVTCPSGWSEEKQNRMGGSILVGHNHNPAGIREWPVTIRASLLEGVIIESATDLGSAQSALLVNVPEGLAQDVREAERCHFSFSPNPPKDVLGDSP